MNTRQLAIKVFEEHQNKLKQLGSLPDLNTNNIQRNPDAHKLVQSLSQSPRISQILKHQLQYDSKGSGKKITSPQSLVSNEKELHNNQSQDNPSRFQIAQGALGMMPQNATITGKGMQLNQRMAKKQSKINYDSQLLGLHGNQKQRRGSILQKRDSKELLRGDSRFNFTRQNEKSNYSRSEFDKDEIDQDIKLKPIKPVGKEAQKNMYEEGIAQQYGVYDIMEDTSFLSSQTKMDNSLRLKKKSKKILNEDIQTHLKNNIILNDKRNQFYQNEESLKEQKQIGEITVSQQKYITAPQIDETNIINYLNMSSCSAQQAPNDYNSKFQVPFFNKNDGDIIMVENRIQQESEKEDKNEMSIEQVNQNKIFLNEIEKQQKNQTFFISPNINQKHALMNITSSNEFRADPQNLNNTHFQQMYQNFNATHSNIIQKQVQNLENITLMNEKNNTPYHIVKNQLIEIVTHHNPQISTHRLGSTKYSRQFPFVDHGVESYANLSNGNNQDQDIENQRKIINNAVYFNRQFQSLTNRYGFSMKSNRLLHLQDSNQTSLVSKRNIKNKFNQDSFYENTIMGVEQMSSRMQKNNSIQKKFDMKIYQNSQNLQQIENYSNFDQTLRNILQKTDKSKKLELNNTIKMMQQRLVISPLHVQQLQANIKKASGMPKIIIKNQQKSHMNLDENSNDKDSKQVNGNTQNTQEEGFTLEHNNQQISHKLENLQQNQSNDKNKQSMEIETKQIQLSQKPGGKNLQASPISTNYGGGSFRNRSPQIIKKKCTSVIQEDDKIAKSNISENSQTSQNQNQSKSAEGSKNFAFNQKNANQYQKNILADSFYSSRTLKRVNHMHVVNSIDRAKNMNKDLQKEFSQSTFDNQKNNLQKSFMFSKTSNQVNEDDFKDQMQIYQQQIKNNYEEQKVIHDSLQTNKKLINKTYFSSLQNSNDIQIDSEIQSNSIISKEFQQQHYLDRNEDSPLLNQKMQKQQSGNQQPLTIHNIQIHSKLKTNQQNNGNIEDNKIPSSQFKKMNINYIAIINGVNQEKGKVFQPQNPKSKIKKLDEEEEMRSNEKSIKRKNYIGSEEDSITSGQDEFYDEDGLSIEQSQETNQNQRFVKEQQRTSGLKSVVKRRIETFQKSHTKNFKNQVRSNPQSQLNQSNFQNKTQTNFIANESHINQINEQQDVYIQSNEDIQSKNQKRNSSQHTKSTKKKNEDSQTFIMVQGGDPEMIYNAILQGQKIASKPAIKISPLKVLDLNGLINQSQGTVLENSPINLQDSPASILRSAFNLQQENVETVNIRHRSSNSIQKEFANKNGRILSELSNQHFFGNQKGFHLKLPNIKDQNNSFQFNQTLDKNQNIQEKKFQFFIQNKFDQSPKNQTIFSKSGKFGRNTGFGASGKSDAATDKKVTNMQLYTTQKINEFHNSGTMSRFGKSGSESLIDIKDQNRFKNDQKNDNNNDLIHSFMNLKKIQNINVQYINKFGELIQSLEDEVINENSQKSLAVQKLNLRQLKENKKHLSSNQSKALLRINNIDLSNLNKNSSLNKFIRITQTQFTSPSKQQIIQVNQCQNQALNEHINLNETFQFSTQSQYLGVPFYQSEKMNSKNQLANPHRKSLKKLQNEIQLKKKFQQMQRVNTSFKHLPEEINQTLRKNNIMLQITAGKKQQQKNNLQIQIEPETLSSRSRHQLDVNKTNFGFRFKSPEHNKHQLNFDHTTSKLKQSLKQNQVIYPQIMNRQIKQSKQSLMDSEKLKDDKKFVIVPLKIINFKHNNKDQKNITQHIIEHRGQSIDPEQLIQDKTLYGTFSQLGVNFADSRNRTKNVDQKSHFHEKKLSQQIPSSIYQQFEFNQEKKDIKKLSNKKGHQKIKLKKEQKDESEEMHTIFSNQFIQDINSKGDIHDIDVYKKDFYMQKLGSFKNKRQTVPSLFQQAASNKKYSVPISIDKTDGFKKKEAGIVVAQNKDKKNDQLLKRLFQSVI